MHSIHTHACMHDCLHTAAVLSIGESCTTCTRISEHTCLLACIHAQQYLLPNLVTVFSPAWLVIFAVDGGDGAGFTVNITARLLHITTSPFMMELARCWPVKTGSGTAELLKPRDRKAVPAKKPTTISETCPLGWQLHWSMFRSHLTLELPRQVLVKRSCHRDWLTQWRMMSSGNCNDYVLQILLIASRMSSEYVNKLVCVISIKDMVTKKLPMCPSYKVVCQRSGINLQT